MMPAIRAMMIVEIIRVMVDIRYDDDYVVAMIIDLLTDDFVIKRRYCYYYWRALRKMLYELFCFML